MLDIRVEKSSGNRIYDEAILRAIRSASPLPVPPATDVVTCAVSTWKSRPARIEMSPPPPAAASVDTVPPLRILIVSVAVKAMRPASPGPELPALIVPPSATSIVAAFAAIVPPVGVPRVRL